MKTCEHCGARTTKPCFTEAGTVGCRHLQAKKDAEKIERDRHIAFMKKPDDWPRWPLLPLKRPGARGQYGLGEAGFLLAGRGATVYRGVIFHLDPGQPWDDLSREMYESFEAITRGGWRVD